MNHIRKLVISAVALTVVAVLAISGTFAWQQAAKKVRNEAQSTVNPGGRLHDDFNGTNKDVYVENFSTPGEGTEIYARVRLTEYMERGADAGEKTGDTVRNVTVIDPDTKIGDETTWKVHKFNDPDNKFAAYWDWQLGGSKVYMPTFNMNKDSLKADINGTWEVKGADGAPYGDYKEYALNDTLAGIELRDIDTDNDIDEGDASQVGVNHSETPATHTAQSTLNATVISMEQWKTEKNSQPGPYWVWDTDGWVYWAQAIQPGTATGLLLDGITMKTVLSDSWYYVINVEGQFATGDDLGWQDTASRGGFYKDGLTEDAENLLAAMKAMPKPRANAVEITAQGDTTYLPGTQKTMTFKAVVKLDNADAADQTVVWSIVGNTDAGTKITAGTGGTATLTVSAKESADRIAVTATHTDYSSVKYEGTVSVRSNLVAIKEDINAITPGSTSTVTIDGITWYVLAKDTVNDRALLLSANILTERPFYLNGTTNNNNWKDSTLRPFLNAWLNEHATIKANAVEVTLYSQHQINDPAVDTTQDKVFLLSQADVFGTWYNGGDQAVTDMRLYTYNGAPLPLKDNDPLKALLNDARWWLRSPCGNAASVAYVEVVGTLNDNYCSSRTIGVRPAFWYDLSK